MQPREEVSRRPWTVLFFGAITPRHEIMKFAETFRIRFTESDRHGRATPVAVFNLLQETAIAHSASVGRGTDRLVARGLAWMMNRAHVQFLRYPAIDAEVTVTTWAQCLTGLFAIREWTVIDAEGVCAQATGRWIMFDTNRRRVIKIPPDFAETYGEEPERVIDDSFERMNPIESGDYSREFHVRVSDLDTNQHANSGCYFDWALEAVPVAIASTRRPAAVEMLFKKESVLGEGLLSSARQVEPGSERNLRFHHTVAGLSGDPRAVAYSHWPAEPEFEAP